MKFMDLVWSVYFSLPPGLRQKLRLVLKRGPGHESSQFNGVIAMRNANGKCRIDRFAQMLSDDLTASGIAGIEDRRCLEIGTGYVGSSPVVMWLLGARTVTTIDLNRLLVPAALKASILAVEKHLLFNILKKHVSSEERLNDRIDRVYALAAAKQGDLQECFTYLAPFDIFAAEFAAEFDFIFSTSTLEHIPRSIVHRFLEKTASILAAGGVALHFIDLTDHFDRAGNPFGFLTLEPAEYSEDSQADSRGNRIRGSEWLDIFSRAGLAANIVMSSDALPSQLPRGLVAPFNAMNSQDLMRTAILVRVDKQSATKR